MTQRTTITSLSRDIETEADAYRYLERLRWEGRPRCAHCSSFNVYLINCANGVSRKTRTGNFGARPVEQKKGADRGIDGRLFFHGQQGGETDQVVLSVKAGHVTVSQVRDLRGVVERENAAIAVLISMEQPTAPMRKEAAACTKGRGGKSTRGFNCSRLASC